MQANVPQVRFLPHLRPETEEPRLRRAAVLRGEEPAGRGTGDSGNGHSDETVLTEDGTVELAVPRDRNGGFEPAIVPKGERRLDGFDDRILSLYTRGMTVRETLAHLRELYTVEVSPDPISGAAAKSQ